MYMDGSNTKLTANCDSSKNVWHKFCPYVNRIQVKEMLHRLIEKNFQSEKTCQDSIATH